MHNKHVVADHDFARGRNNNTPPSLNPAVQKWDCWWHTSRLPGLVLVHFLNTFTLLLRVTVQHSMQILLNKMIIIIIKKNAALYKKSFLLPYISWIVTACRSTTSLSFAGNAEVPPAPPHSFFFTCSIELWKTASKEERTWFFDDAALSIEKKEESWASTPPSSFSALPQRSARSSGQPLIDVHLCVDVFLLFFFCARCVFWWLHWFITVPSLSCAETKTEASDTGWVAAAALVAVR